MLDEARVGLFFFFFFLTRLAPAPGAEEAATNRHGCGFIFTGLVIGLMAEMEPA